ncbi:MAG: hypothetical protein FJ265_21315 [Planctomycetes bacterium]|nr:hypothetical protein [Planctomycetota bacterium]
MTGRRDELGANVAAGRLLALLVGLLLFGDYLALTASRALTGSPGNWILVTGVLQAPILALALLAGEVRARLPWTLVLGYLGLCAIGLGHAAIEWGTGNELAEYPAQKLAALLLLLGPALACGMLVGASPALPGARTMPWLMAPLLLTVAIALATDPRLLTIAHYAEPPVFFGFLVMPAHQPLAFCLAKAGLLSFALDQQAESPRTLRLLRLGFTGAMLGLVLLTGARSYALAFAVALAAQSFASGRRLGIALVGAAVGIALFQAYASDLVQERFDPAQILESLAYREREQAWQSAWTAFLDHPLAGAGAGGFARAAGFYGRVYPHNLVLEVAVEFGLVGLCCLAAMLAAPVLGLWQRWRQRSAPAVAGVFALGLLVFALGGALAVGDLLRNHFLMFALGMAATALQVQSGAAPARTLAAPQPVPALAAGAGP